MYFIGKCTLKRYTLIVNYIIFFIYSIDPHRDFLRGLPAPWCPPAVDEFLGELSWHFHDSLSPLPAADAAVVFVSEEKKPNKYTISKHNQ